MDRTDALEAAEPALIAAARAGDEAAFERLAAAYRGRLRAYCYRMLGSVQDADDAMQDTLLGAWQGLAGFEGRSSLRSWLYRIATHACLRVAAGRRRRMLSAEHGPSRTDVRDLGDPVREPIWLEPYPDPPAGPQTDPEARYQQRESVELAFVAALQHLPSSQRAVLILREVLQFPAAEVADALETSVAAVNSSLQRARKTVGERTPAASQAAELRALGEPGQRRLVAAFVAAWERADVDALVGLLADDARFSMPPLPAWFSGRADVARFITERLLATPWRVVPVGASGQLAFACYQGTGDRGTGDRGTGDRGTGDRGTGDRGTGGQGTGDQGMGAPAPFRLSAVNVITVRGGQIAELTGFLDPAVHRRFGLAAELPGPR